MRSFKFCSVNVLTDWSTGRLWCDAYSVLVHSNYGLTASTEAFQIRTNVTIWGILYKVDTLDTLCPQNLRVLAENKPPPSEWTRADVTAFWRTQGSQRLWENTQVQHPDRLNSWTGWNHLGRTIQREHIIQQPGVSAWGWSNLRTNTVSDLLDDPRQEYNPQGSATCRLAECEDQKLTDQRSWTFQKPLRRRNFDLSVALRSNRYL